MWKTWSLQCAVSLQKYYLTNLGGAGHRCSSGHRLFGHSDGGVFWTCSLDSCSTIGRADSTVDTGAEVTAISDFSFRYLNGVHLHHASKVLYGPDHSHLDVLGKFSPTLAIEASRTVRTTQQDVYVVKRLILLGLPAIQALQIRHNGAELQRKDYFRISWNISWPGYT